MSDIRTKVEIEEENEETKKLLGKFFTITNPFNIDIFYKWMKLIPKEKKETLLEPFAGANNIVKMVNDLGFTYNWSCYDIEPNENNATPEFSIVKQDTIKNFPKNYFVGITNPPYLAKNSATRAGLEFPETHYDDLYKVSIDVMLKNLDYVAAIIPESFVNADIFHNRMYAFVSLTCKMFEDTECPVCLALFIPTEQKAEVKLAKEDFFVFRQNKKIGKYKNLGSKKPTSKLQIDWKFNDPDGSVGIRCIDGTIKPSIEFIKGTEIDKSKIKVSSRSLTRVSGIPDDIELDKFLENCNKKLTQYREDTADIFLTSFKGLRKDNRYRRRLDFANAKVIMNSVIEDIRKEKAE